MRDICVVLKTCDNVEKVQIFKPNMALRFNLENTSKILINLSLLPKQIVCGILVGKFVVPGMKYKFCRIK